MSAVPLRAAPVFARMSRRTVPLPDPLAAEPKVIHVALLVAVQPQSVDVVMLTFRVPPAAGSAIVSGDTVALQPLPSVTAKVWPPAVIVPVRAAPELLAAENRTVPEPLPLAPD